MSKYNVGDKFLIEIGEIFYNRKQGEKGFRYKIKGFNSLFFDDFGLDKLDMLPVLVHTDNDMEKAKNEAYEAGLKDAWEAAKKIYFNNEDDGLFLKDMIMIFGSDSIRTIFNNYSAKKAVEKIKDFESEKGKNPCR